jgi:hypothetical protein
VTAPAIDADLGPYEDRIQREASDEFWRYVATSARLGPGTPLDHASRIAGLSKKHLGRLATLHWLLSEEVSAFLDEVPSALARLSRTTTPTEAEGQEVRGAINWTATIALRAGTGWRVPTFAYRETESLNDTPSNRVLKAVLGWVVRTAPAFATNPERWADVPAESGRWVAEAIRRSARAARALRHPGLTSVRAPARLSEHELRACAAEPARAYRRAVDAARLRGALIEREDKNAVHAMLRRRVLVPAQQFRLFEIWVLARIARFFRDRGFREAQLALLADQQWGPVYRFKRDGAGPVDVFFQGLPVPMKAASRYKELFESYDLDVAARTPDIVIERGARDDALRLIVEAKASDDPGYVADGVYKALGYVADFAAALPPANSERPAALVVTKTKPTLRAGATRATHRIWIATIDTLDATLVDALAAFAT